MSGFRLLAIRSFEGTPDIILKALKKDVLYSFYRNIEFLDVENNPITGSIPVSKIIDNNVVPDDLYLKDSPSISISAIVGKNGEGKSSLNELFYFFNFVVSVSRNVDFIKDIDGLTRSYFPKNYDGFKLIEFYQNLLKAKLEVFYKSNGSFYKMLFDKDLKKFKYDEVEEVWDEDTISEKLEIVSSDGKDRSIKKPTGLSDFGYTIAINYSMYGLNGKEDYWLNSLFHKNDGYQTPLVINPYREGGQINVSRELHLAQSRTLSNLASFGEDQPEIINGKRLKSIDLFIIPEEFDTVGVYTVSNIIKHHNKEHTETEFDFFNRISKALTGKKLLTKTDIINLTKVSKTIEEKSLIKKFDLQNHPEKLQTVEVKYYLVKYVVRKVFKICFTQKEYKDFFIKKVNTYDNKLPYFLLDNLEKLMEVLVEDESHVTIKLRQAIWAIKESHYFNNWEKTFNPSNPNHVMFKTEVSFNNYKECINKTLFKNQFLKENRALEAIPNAMFKPNMNVSNNDQSSQFRYLSSGEQQLVNSFQTVIYHLRNLESVHYSGDRNKLAYENVTVIFDEIELYFHPEFQRNFISRLVKDIKQLNLKKIKGIQVIFSTHSPFILSDIPKSNILQLEDGVPSTKDLRETFGANIHSILSEGFFLRAQIGEVARDTIQKIIDKLNELRKSSSKISDEDRLSLRTRINIVGDNLVRLKLREMYLEITNDQEFLESEIKELDRQKDELKKLRK